MLGSFLAQDLALFVLFFDLMLVPFYFLVGQWGGPERIPAALKMVVYTLVGSLLMLAAAVATAVLAQTGATPNFSLAYLQANLLGEDTQKLLFAAFAIAFLIKMPAFPFHGWMPDTYRNMPLPALAVFSGVVSKVAAYGFLRIVLPLFPAAAQDWQMILLDLRAAARSSTARSRRSRRRTSGSSSATRRSPSSASSRSGSSRSTTPPRARRARCCRPSTTGSWSRRCS